MPMMLVLKTRFRVEGLGLIERQGLGFRVAQRMDGSCGGGGYKGYIELYKGIIPRLLG